VIEVSVACRSHLVAALLAAGWRVVLENYPFGTEVLWCHEGITGEYTLLEAVRMLK
jgi:hypothetical protein